MRNSCVFPLIGNKIAYECVRISAVDCKKTRSIASLPVTLSTFVPNSHNSSYCFLPVFDWSVICLGLFPQLPPFKERWNNSIVFGLTLLIEQISQSASLLCLQSRTRLHVVRWFQLTCHGPTQRLHMPWAHTTGVHYAKY